MSLAEEIRREFPIENILGADEAERRRFVDLFGEYLKKSVSGEIGAEGEEKLVPWEIYQYASLYDAIWNGVTFQGGMADPVWDGVKFELSALEKWRMSFFDFVEAAGEVAIESEGLFFNNSSRSEGKVQNSGLPEGAAKFFLNGFLFGRRPYPVS